MSLSPLEALPRKLNGSIDLRRATFQDDVDAVLSVGPVLTSFKRIGVAIRDPRCKRPHLVVLYRIMEHVHRETGTSFESRKTIAEGEDLSEKTVENVLYDLRRWGHVDWERRPAPGIHPGRLLHYVLPVCRLSDEDIDLVIRKMRGGEEQKLPVLEGTNSTRPDGEFSKESTRPDGHSDYPSQRGLLLESTRPNGEFSSKSPRPGGVSNIYYNRDIEDGSESTRPNGEFLASVEAALDLYNESAKTHGFTVCRTPTPQLKKRLGSRIADIGGIEKFKLALTIIPGDDFLMGRKPPRPGEKPFKLNLHRLLRTSDTMGDVLAGLVDRALDDSDPKRTSNKATSQYRVPSGSSTSYWNYSDGIDRG